MSKNTIAVFAPLTVVTDPDAIQVRPVVYHDEDIRHPGRTGVVTIAEGYMAEVHPTDEVKGLIQRGKLQEVPFEQWLAIDGERRKALAEQKVVPAVGTAWYVGNLSEYATVDPNSLESLGLSRDIVQKLRGQRISDVEELVSQLEAGADLTDKAFTALSARQRVVVEQALLDRGLVEPVVT